MTDLVGFQSFHFCDGADGVIMIVLLNDGAKNDVFGYVELHNSVTHGGFLSGGGLLVLFLGNGFG